MSDDAGKQATDAYFQQPFSPARNISAENRVANALEYIAAQLGTIARAAERIAEQYPKKKE